MSLCYHGEHSGWQQRIEKELVASEQFQYQAKDAKRKTGGKVLPYKLLPGALTVANPKKRFMMLNSSATNLQNPSSMHDLGYVYDIPQIDDDQLSQIENKNSKVVSRERERFMTPKNHKTKQDIMAEISAKKKEDEIKKIVDKAQKIIQDRSESKQESEHKSVQNKQLSQAEVEYKEAELDNLIKTEEEQNEKNYENEDTNYPNAKFEDPVNNEDATSVKSYRTTSTMRSKLKGLETKERVKLLMKRSMSLEQLNKVKDSIDDKLQEMGIAMGKTGEFKENPQDRLKSDLDKLNSLNNPISRTIEEDAVSVKSNGSRKSGHDAKVSNNKMVNYVRLLKEEIEKEKSAKNSALSILKGLKKKDKKIDDAIHTLIKNSQIKNKKQSVIEDQIELVDQQDKNQIEFNNHVIPIEIDISNEVNEEYDNQEDITGLMNLPRFHLDNIPAAKPNDGVQLDLDHSFAIYNDSSRGENNDFNCDDESEQLSD